MKHISQFLPSVSEIARLRERALLREEIKRRKFLTDFIAIRFADSTFSATEYA